MPTIGSTVFKDPADELLYVIDWTNFLGDNTISASEWAVTGPDDVLTNSNASIAAGNLKTQIRLEAGTVGNKYTITNTITLSGNPEQTVERSFYVKVRQR